MVEQRLDEGQDLACWCPCHRITGHQQCTEAPRTKLGARPVNSELPIANERISDRQLLEAIWNGLAALTRELTGRGMVVFVRDVNGQETRLFEYNPQVLISRIVKGVDCTHDADLRESDSRD